MSSESITAILKKLEEYNVEQKTRLDDFHKLHESDFARVMDEMQITKEQNFDLKAQLTALDLKVAPIVEIYTDLNGTKKVMKYVMISLSLLIGLVLSIRQLLHK